MLGMHLKGQIGLRKEFMEANNSRTVCFETENEHVLNFTEKEGLKYIQNY